MEQEASDRKNAMKDSETAIAKYKEQQNNVRNNREFESLDKENRISNVRNQAS
jgi:uncharacterized protein